MMLDPSVSSQTYVEDCEVCCNPLEIYAEFEEGELAGFEARNLEQ